MATFSLNLDENVEVLDRFPFADTFVVGEGINYKKMEVYYDDNFVLSDVRNNSLKRLFSGALSVAESTKLVVGKFLDEVKSISDKLLKNYWITNSFTLSDASLVRDVRKYYVDNYALKDNLFIKEYIFLSEEFTLRDIKSFQVDYLLSSSLVLSDYINKAFYYTDSVSLSDSFSRHIISVQEASISIIDNYYRQVNKLNVGSLSLSDIFLYHLWYELEDKFTLSDIVNSGINLYFDYSVSIRDNISKNVVPLLISTVSISDILISKNVKVLVKDVLNLNDIVLKSIFISNLQVLNLVDSSLISLYKYYTDNYSLQDVISKKVSLINNGSVALQDAGVIRGRNLSEVVTLADVKRLVDYRIVNMVSVSDILSTFIAKQLQDSSSLNDFFMIKGMIFLSETFTPQDSAVNYMNRGKVITDTLSFVDSVSKLVSLRYRDDMYLYDGMRKISYDMWKVDEFKLQALISKHLPEFYSDGLSVGDNIDFPNSIYTEMIDMTDILTKTISFTLQQYLSIDDLISFNIRILNEGRIKINDIMSRKAKFVYEDNLILKDYVNKYSRITRYGALSLADKLSNSVFILSADLLEVKDLSRIIEVHRLQVGKLFILDIIHRKTAVSMNLDNLSIADYLYKQYNITNELNVLDEVLYSLKRSVQDNIKLKDVVYTARHTLYSFVRQKILVGISVRNYDLYDVKAVDVQRVGNLSVSYPTDSNRKYLGFGRTEVLDYLYTIVLWLKRPKSNIDKIINTIHKNVQGYKPEGDVVNGATVMWVKIMSEENLQRQVRGFQVYKINLQVRTYRMVNTNE